MTTKYVLFNTRVEMDATFGVYMRKVDGEWCIVEVDQVFPGYIDAGELNHTLGAGELQRLAEINGLEDEP